MKLRLCAKNAKLYSHQRLIEAAEARGHTIDVIRTLNCYMNIAMTPSFHASAHWSHFIASPFCANLK
jgi:hypothetical protein